MRYPHSTATLILASALVTLSACGGDLGDDRAPTTRAQRLGEPVGEYPSWEERAVLYLTNRARAEPSAFNPEPVYEPTPPLKWNVLLNEAARFHARHIVEASCWCEDHSSCCALAEVDGEVACAGAVGGCGGTDPATRVGLFTPAYSGENMATGQQSPADAVEGWIFSPPHWSNMNSPGHTLLGPGHYQVAWVQDFGQGGAGAPVIGDGVHLQRSSPTTFGITYFQPGTGGPRSALVIVDGECHELELAYGEPEHGAFETSLSLEPGCHRYYFHFTDGDGADHTYPTSGSLGVGINAECALYVETRPADTCSPSGQSCETGHTRACYTGPFGTKNEGICTAGTERCVGGQWTGECRGEVNPAEAEACGNALDDDCDGVVDEGCATPEDAGSPDAGAMGRDAGDGTEAPGGGAMADSPDGCTIVGAGARPGIARIWPLALLGLFLTTRRRRPTRGARREEEE